MHALVKTAFTRLYVLDPEEEELKLADNGNDSQEGVEMNVTTDARVASANPPEPEPALEGEVPTSAEAEAQSADVAPQIPDVAPEVDPPPQSEGGEPEGIRQKCRLIAHSESISNNTIYYQTACLLFWSFYGS